MLFYGESVLAAEGNAVLVIGTDLPTEEISGINTLVIPSDTDVSAVGALMSAYEIGTVYIPDNDELYEICSGYDSFVVRVEGSMSFGIGAASVSVTACEGKSSLVTRISMG
ncbi:MAG: hypothetical protein IKU19_07730, partial [Clostridia bacterium]|nr:hypothetical protein [Clostridia bacterium]